MFLYRLLITVGFFCVPFIGLYRIVVGKDTFKTLLNRFGYDPQPATKAKCLWMHAVSFGEFNTLKLLIAPVLDRMADHHLLITVSNKAAYEHAMALQSENVHIRIAPLDYIFVIKKFLSRWQPNGLITLENEVYPNRITLCAQKNIPIIFVNARMSEKSYKRWAKNAQLAQAVFSQINICFAQDKKSFERFLKLGVPKANTHMLGNLKQFQGSTPAIHPDFTGIQNAFPKHLTLCAASTHKGEDRVLLNAFKLARKTNPDLKLILTPRHTNRTGEIETLIKQTGLSYAVRSKDQMLNVEHDVYLADTMGEMALWYSASAITFVAGSLVDVGGHTPYEPALYGSAIMHGPFYSNFQNIYEELLNSDGSTQVKNAQDIAQKWIGLLDHSKRNTQISKAKAILFKGANRDKIIHKIVQNIADLL